MNLYVRVRRSLKSYNYKRDVKKPDDWLNNDNNNMLDIFELFAGETIMLKVHCQTVANIPGGRHLDTIAPGSFRIKAFIGEGPNADPRNFYGRIHGICDCYDMDGQYIDDSSVERVRGKNGAPEDFSRWLVHDTQKHKPSPPMELTRVAWSAGCFIMIPSDLTALGTILDAYKVQPYNFIEGELIEVP